MRQHYRSFVAAARAFALILVLAEPARAGEEAAEPFAQMSCSKSLNGRQNTTLARRRETRLIV